uniref:F-box domain-containing protein n=1 Tax=Caenorhabditis tropicalis TaxID=1561998 RepID=A0A1I7UMZ9_9PELO
MPFHLFRLPESIQIDIINTMNPCEQFFTSLCSRKTYSIIKTNRRAIEGLVIYTEGDFDLNLEDFESTYLKFHQSFENPNQELENLIIDGNSIRYELKEDKVINTFWAEPIFGTMKLIEYVCDLFNVVVGNMDIHWNSGDGLMKWVQSRQKRLQSVHFESYNCQEHQFTPETLTSLIMDCQAEWIILNAQTTQPLQPFHKKCDFFNIEIGTWFSLEHLIPLDCIDISVTGRQFTSTEMHRFFKHWMNGGSPRLLLLEIKLDNYNEQELMDGIDVKWNMRKHCRYATDGAIHILDGFFEIQKTTNGMSAGFRFKDGLLYFAVWKSSFYLFRLPHLAFMSIINEMGATEQFLTSLCSHTAFSIIKTYRRRSKDITLSAGDKRLVLTQGNERLVSYQFEEDSRTRDIVTVNGHPTSFSYSKKKATINTLWADPIVGSMELVEHLSNLFDIQVDKVVIEKYSGTRFMNWVQRRQRSLRMVEETSFNEIRYQFESETLKNIIMECEADHIQLNALHSSPFEIQNLNKKFNVFECLNGTWITVDNLMTLDCIRITVEEKWFMCAELNIFIKHWLQGGSPRLKMLLVGVAENNEDVLLEGLYARWNTERMVVVNIRGAEYQINTFWEVDRNDGMTAGFVVDIATGLFWFGVWPSDTGNFIDLCSY